MSIEIGVDDPRREDVRELLELHWEFASACSPPEHCHSLDIDGLVSPLVTFVSARHNGALLGIGALMEADPSHGELKSMHTAEAARGRGVGQAIVEHLLDLARTRGYARVSLETGTGPPFVPAQALYARAGFAPCEPFGDYTSNVYSFCMTRTLD